MILFLYIIDIDCIINDWIAFNNDLKKDFDLKNEIKKQIENKIENLNIL